MEKREISDLDYNTLWNPPFHKQFTKSSELIIVLNYGLNY